MEKLENGSPAPQKPEGGHKPSKPYKIKIDGKMYEVQGQFITGREILMLAQKSPVNDYEVGFKEHGHDVRIIGLDERVDLEMPGIEKFVTIPTGHTDGEEGPNGPFPFMLTGEDHVYAEKLAGKLERVIDGTNRWVLIHDFAVPSGYNVESVTAAIMLPPGYPSCGPDMVYFYPALSLSSGKKIHAAEATMTIQGKTYQRWSRHFTPKEPWRPEVDSLETYSLMIHSWLEKELTR